MATMVGAAVGSMVGSYFVAVKATRRRLDSEPPRAPLPSTPEPRPDPRLDAMERSLQGLEREMRQEIRGLEGRLAEALTVEEFQAYTKMDSDRRERLVEKIGELNGAIAALLPRVRK